MNGSKHSLVDYMSIFPTSGETTVDEEQDILCFLTEYEGLKDILKDDELVTVDTRAIDSIFQPKLPPDFIPSAITHYGCVRDQGADKFCPENMPLLSRRRMRATAN